MFRFVNGVRIPLLTLLMACPGPQDTADTAPVDTTVPWTRIRPRLADAVSPVRGRVPSRVITHLHSPYSHDACDGDGLIDGVVNEPCLLDLRRGLCEAAIDVAFVSDHPAYAAEPDFEQLWHPRDGDTPIAVSGAPIGNAIPCDDGTTTLYLPGFEDTLMPLGLTEHLPGTPRRAPRRLQPVRRRHPTSHDRRRRPRLHRAQRGKEPGLSAHPYGERRDGF